jgi:hypothetical protein
VVDSNEFLKSVANAFHVRVPSDEEIEDVLRIASVAAHSSERKMAPIVCWLSALAGLSPEEALEIVASVASQT